MNTFTLRIPVKTYIKKYLGKLYGEEVIPAQMETNIGFVVLMTISSRLEGKVCRGYNNQFQNPYQSSVTFTVPFHYFYLTKKELSIHTVILLNRYFETKFEEDLCRFIDSFMIRGGTYKAAIEAFAELYNIDIEEDITYEALKKKDYRFRKKNENLFLRRLSPEVDLFTRQTA